MYLVDTNVLSEARRGTTAARDWLRSVDPEAIYLSVITLGEIMKGIELRQRTDPRAAGSLRQWLDQLRQDHADRILPVGDEVALEWGRLAAERPRAMADALIAATAIVHRKTIVTRNSADFEETRVPVINPWQL
jgi:predicted nucleic acid-binding protein